MNLKPIPIRIVLNKIFHKEQVLKLRTVLKQRIEENIQTISTGERTLYEDFNSSPYTAGITLNKYYKR